MSKNEKGAIAGGVVGGIALLVGIGAVAWILVRHKNVQRGVSNTESLREMPVDGREEGMEQTRPELDGLARAELSSENRLER